jgi:hypothetical protein
MTEDGEYALSNSDSVEKTVKKMLLRSLDLQGYFFHMLRIENAYLGNYSSYYFFSVSEKIKIFNIYLYDCLI